MTKRRRRRRAGAAAPAAAARRAPSNHYVTARARGDCGTETLVYRRSNVFGVCACMCPDPAQTVAELPRIRIRNMAAVGWLREVRIQQAARVVGKCSLRGRWRRLARLNDSLHIRQRLDDIGDTGSGQLTPGPHRADRAVR